jgi:hypothetical protein
MTLPASLLRGAALALAEKSAALASRRLCAARLPHLVIKGLAAAHVLYPDPLDRAFRDVDLWVPPERLDEAILALLDAGFSCQDALRTGHSAAMGSAIRGAPDLDVQSWLGYPLAPRGGFATIEGHARWITTRSGPIPVPSAADQACVAALFAVRDRLRPSTATLLEDLARGAAIVGREALLDRARRLGLSRVVSVALSAVGHPDAPWVRALGALDRAAPRPMSALPALLLDGPRAIGAFALAAGVLTSEHLARRP